MDPVLKRVKAKAFGTTAGHDGTIIHVNPKADDERYHSPVVDERDIPLLVERGLIEVDGDAKVVELPLVIDTANAADVAAARTAVHAKTDAQTNDAPSALPSRDSTNFPADQNVRGAVEGRVDGPSLEATTPAGTGVAADDPDAPPAPPAAKKKT